MEYAEVPPEQNIVSSSKTSGGLAFAVNTANDIAAVMKTIRRNLMAISPTEC
jgi:hypothetical protein